MCTSYLCELVDDNQGSIGNNVLVVTTVRLCTCDDQNATSVGNTIALDYRHRKNADVVAIGATIVMFPTRQLKVLGIVWWTSQFELLTCKKSNYNTSFLEHMN